MGDRCNIVVTQARTQGRTLPQILADKPVVFYGHWAGAVMPYRLQKAIARKERWNDIAYLARIIFCEFVTEEHWNDETGYGISTGKICDNEHLIAVVSVEDQTVCFFEEGGTEAVRSWSFTSYARAKKEAIGAVYNPAEA